MATFPKATPHGALQEVTKDVYCVQGTFDMGPGMRISRTMTVVRTDGGLVILNSVRLSDESELEKLGQVKHVVKLSDSHGIDDPYYVERFGAEFWCLEGAKGVPGNARRLGPESPIPGAKVCQLADTQGWREAALLVPEGGGTLITSDVVQNCSENLGVSFLARLMTPMLGFKGGLIVPKMWRKFQKVGPAKIRATLSDLNSQPFDVLISGHGEPIVGRASEKVAAAIDAVAAD